jgi:hypothetical protein
MLDFSASSSVSSCSIPQVPTDDHHSKPTMTSCIMAGYGQPNFGDRSVESGLGQSTVPHCALTAACRIRTARTTHSKHPPSPDPALQAILKQLLTKPLRPGLPNSRPSFVLLPPSPLRQNPSSDQGHSNSGTLSMRTLTSS